MANNLPPNLTTETEQQVYVAARRLMGDEVVFDSQLEEQVYNALEEAGVGGGGGGGGSGPLPANTLPVVAGTAAIGTSARYARADHVHPAQESAEKLKTPRKLGANLAATDEATFDGSADQLNIPVTGTLPVAKGGTGVTAIANIQAGKDVDGNAIKTTYAKLDSPALTGTPTAPTAATATDNTQIATTAFVHAVVTDALSVADAMVFKGTVAAATDLPSLPTVENGWSYKATDNFSLGGVSVIAGALIVALVEGEPATLTWEVLQTNADGSVTGPASSVDADIAVFAGTAGNVLADSGKKLENTLTDDANKVPTSHAVYDAIPAPYTGAAPISVNASTNEISISAATTSAAGSMSAADKTKLDGIVDMTGATASADGAAGLVPKPEAGQEGTYLRGDGTWATPPGASYTAGTGLDLTNTEFSIEASGVTAGTYGTTANATPAFGATFNTMDATVDATGRITLAHTRTVTIPDAAMTGATEGADGAKGLVPAPSAGDETKFLRGDGTWQTVSSDTVSDATKLAKGIVQIGDNIDVASGVISVPEGAANKKGVLQVGTNLHVTDGVVSVADASTIGKGVVQLETTLTGTSGLVPDSDAVKDYVDGAVQTYTGTAPISINASNEISISAATELAGGYMSAGDKTKLDGIVGMTGATASADGTAGLVPAPSAGDQTKYFRGDGTWQVIADKPWTGYEADSSDIVVADYQNNAIIETDEPVGGSSLAVLAEVEQSVSGQAAMVPSSAAVKAAFPEKVTDIYVDGTNGSDDNDGLTAATAVATIAKGLAVARDVHPLANIGAYVHIADGTYNETVSIGGQSVALAINSAVTVSGISCSSSASVNITADSANATLTITGRLVVNSAAYCWIDSKIALTAGNIEAATKGCLLIRCSSTSLTPINTHGVIAYSGSEIHISNAVSITMSSDNNAVYAGESAGITIGGNLTVSGTLATAVFAHRGSTIVISGNVISTSFTGSRIFYANKFGSIQSNGNIAVSNASLTSYAIYAVRSSNISIDGTVDFSGDVTSSRFINADDSASISVVGKITASFGSGTTTGINLIVSARCSSVALTAGAEITAASTIQSVLFAVASGYLYSSTIVFNGTVSVGVAQSTLRSFIEVKGSTGSGTATGKKYICETGGAIAGAAKLPGDQAGTADATTFCFAS